MIDLPLPEQFDRFLWAAAIGLAIVPLWLLCIQAWRRRTSWHALGEFLALGFLSLGAATAVFVGTLGDLRAYVPIGFMLGLGAGGGILGALRRPWQETERRRRI